MSDRRSLKDGGAGRAARVRIDLHAAFSGPARWLIAALVTAAVVALAWLVGRDDPVPDWISKGLVPALGWIYLVLLLVALVYWLRRRRTAEKEEES